LKGPYRFWREPGSWKEAWNLLKALLFSLLILGFTVEEVGKFGGSKGAAYP